MGSTEEVRFGTSGVRGLATALTGGAAFAYTMAFCKLMAQRGALSDSPVLIGCDRRDSSGAIAGQCAGAITTCGATPVDCGQLPTPALALLALEKGVPAVMVSGSHIPADRNGLKFYRPDGEIDKQDEAAIAAAAAELQANKAAQMQASAERSQLPQERYTTRCHAIAGELDLAGLRIGLFEHSAVSNEIIAEVLERAGCEVVRFGASARFVPVDTEAVSEAMAKEMREVIRLRRLDGVVSTDADGDRPLIMDEQGGVMAGDLVGFVTAQTLGASTIITPVSSNSAIETQFDGTVIRTRIGSPFVIEALNGAGKGAVGFEANGGTIVGSGHRLGNYAIAPLPTRDAMIGIVCVLATICANGPLSGLAQTCGFKETRKDRVADYPRERGNALIQSLSARPDEFDAQLAPLGQLTSIDRTDGARFIFADGTTLHLRMSGNAPELRIYAEAVEGEVAQNALMTGITLAKGWPG